MYILHLTQQKLPIFVNIFGTPTNKAAIIEAQTTSNHGPSALDGVHRPSAQPGQHGVHDPSWKELRVRAGCFLRNVSYIILIIKTYTLRHLDNTLLCCRSWSLNHFILQHYTAIWYNIYNIPFKLLRYFLELLVVFLWEIRHFYFQHVFQHPILKALSCFWNPRHCLPTCFMSVWKIPFPLVYSFGTRPLIEFMWGFFEVCTPTFKRAACLTVAFNTPFLKKGMIPRKLPNQNAQAAVLASNLVPQSMSDIQTIVPAFGMNVFSRNCWRKHDKTKQHWNTTDISL